MGNAKTTKKRKNRYNYSINRKKKLKKKAKRRIKIQSVPVKEAWEETKGVYDNLRDMGLAADPNEALSIAGSSKKVKAPKRIVVKKLEEEASQPTANTLRLSGDNVKFCVYMLEKYDEDYVAMARDRKNYFQETPAQIRQKIQTFKKIPEQWNAYLRAKEMV
ncbi:nucleolar protein 16 [Ixodes scapularis]|uniref:Nucleolar protein 16 n=1 Tax=Ixodes scapularis TaxID=6945 RepID=B7PXV8_IXOSC|nr:nucleolar protein 16 [Ixodes scapularis]EEC11430.1 conserved hypothetical protein [Ixodes scapularis]|eukprot:XP_002401960.1 conserved hypothetical protein [Ixodes scapularis]